MRPLPRVRRTADLVFAGAKVAVFLDGCFWHGCPDHHTVASTNATYWADKVRRNRERDAETDRLLAEAGWLSIRAWEHDDPSKVAKEVASTVRSRSSGSFSRDASGSRACSRVDGPLSVTHVSSSNQPREQVRRTSA